MEPHNPTATEVTKGINEWEKKQQEARERFLEPLLNKLLELMRRNGQS